MVRTRQEIEDGWVEEGRSIVLDNGDCQLWMGDGHKEMSLMNWKTGRLYVYKRMDTYQKKLDYVVE